MKNNLDKQIKMNFHELVKIIKKLRSSKGCDWDKSQTSDSLLPYFIEEVYELIAVSYTHLTLPTSDLV